MLPALGLLQPGYGERVGHSADVVMTAATTWLRGGGTRPAAAAGDQSTSTRVIHGASSRSRYVGVGRQAWSVDHAQGVACCHAAMTCCC